MLRTLALVTVGQQHRQAAQPAPFALSGGDELIDDDLGIVGEIAELGLPDYHHPGRRTGIAIFEAQHAFLRQQRVVDAERGGRLRQMFQRSPEFAGHLIMKRGMPMEECTAPDILATESDRITLLQQRRIRQRFGESPIHGCFPGRHGLAAFDDGRRPWMQGKAGRQAEKFISQCLNGIQRQTRVIRRSPLLTDKLRPNRLGVDFCVIDQRAGHDVVPVQRRLVILLQGALIGSADDAGGNQPFGVQATHRRLLADEFVHDRLGDGGLVRLVMPVTAVADQVNDHVPVELHPVIDRQPRDEDHRLRIVAVHMEHRRLDHVGDIGTVQGGSGVERVAGGEADLVVDDDVQRAPGGVGPGFRHVQRFHHHALAGKGRVAVDQDGHHLVLAVVRPAILAGAHRTLDDRIDDFQMRGIEGQGRMHRAVAGENVGRKAHVIFDVARAGKRRTDRRALEFLEQRTGLLAEDVDQHVQPAPVRHANHDLANALLAGAFQRFVQQRDQAFRALKGKPFLADILAVQIALDALGGGQGRQQRPLFIGLRVGPAPGVLESRLNPVLDVAVDDMHVLGADVLAIGLPQQRQNFTQGQAAGVMQDVDVEMPVQILLSQAIVGRVQILQAVDRARGQRVVAGDLMAAASVLIDKLVHRRLLAQGGLDLRLLFSQVHRPGVPRGRKFRRGLLNQAEFFPPARIDRVGIAQKALVEILEKAQVVLGDRRRAFE